ncbi:branched-chain amino acid ABC transporter permease [Thermoproteus tenax]|uniref:ABC-type branched-chain amino acid transport system, permease component n=1 Tax=Thermoproteus tenax (strain ATCC 35583 / DSM 2078 / JCM 9277 / NBRC 100435 / Kra 1) TaxID=768679 RepID=G4RNB9_THETK|nr:branched-chain amino acid ABC transporter permease [Thermoproteus tenax]CCC81063.1 ABC-type branched-chain amino acid transport system, permease component [Thermoproteus tenax Kra 1]
MNIADFLVPVLIFWINLTTLSLGLVIVYGSTRVLNLAHGSFFALGGFLASYFAGMWGLGAVALAVAVAVPASLLFYLYVKSLASGELEQIVATYALLLIMEGIYKYLFGSGLYTTASYAAALGSAGPVPAAYLITAAAVLLALALFAFMLYRTTLGVYSRAMLDDKEMAESLGVNVRVVEAVLVMIGIVLATAGGALASMWQSFSLGISAEVLPYAFAVIVIGGLDSVWGIVAASALVSLVRTAVVFFYPRLELVILYLIVLAVLILRPKGLFVRHARSI